MTDRYLVEPDVEFIKEVERLGGDTLKKCFQCATCSVACPISPDTKPFPRKEMIAASWGLKDKLVGNADIWLCHHCGDCTAKCPRGAKPGETLSAIRSYAVQEYAEPKSIGKLVNDPKKWWVLVLIPAVLFYVIGQFIDLIFGTQWLNLSPGGEEIVQSHFFNTWLVDLIFVPLSMWTAAVFALALKRFVNDIHQNALLEGKTDKETIDPKGFGQALLNVIPTILKHNKFSECQENESRSTAHLMVFYSFIGLAIVTGVFFLALYGLGAHGPYPQWFPVKWLANVSGIMLIIGSCLMIKERMSKKDDQPSSYKDWYLLALVLGLGVTGMLTELFRLGGWAFGTYFIYYLHLIFVFNLFAFLPFSKLAHLVYRTVAMAYADYAGRK